MKSKTRKAAGKASLHPLVRHPGLYRAQLSCRIARDVIEGKTAAPADVSHLEWAMFNLLHAVEEIATAMMPNAHADGSAVADTVRRDVGEMITP